MKNNRITDDSAHSSLNTLRGRHFFTLTTLLTLALCFGGVWSVPAQAGSGTTLTISGTGPVTVQWNSGGTLQTAPTVQGPWTTYSNSVSVSSSTMTAVSGTARFFRVVNNGVAGQPVPILPNALPGPLQVVSATLQLLPSPVPSGNTRLVLTMVPGSISSSNVITLLVNGMLTQLRDDGQFPDVTAGDGNFSAVVNVNPSDLEGWNAEMANLPQTSQVSYSVSERSIVATNQMQPINVSNFTAGQIVKFVDNSLPAAGQVAFAGPCSGSPFAYNPFKTVMITDLSVVADPTRTWDNHGPIRPFGVGGVGTQMGAWTFGRLMTDICNQPATGITPSDFTLRMLQSYAVPQTLNSDVVPPVPNVVANVIAPWQAATAAEGTFPPGAIDLSIAPMRLLAIVNRLDLRGNSTYGAPITNPPPPLTELAGEARFVFGVLDTNGNPSDFTIILEYGVPIFDCAGVQAWANQWASLNALPLPSAAFNNALQAITDQFAKANENPMQMPNRSAIDQIRGNDFLGAQWELRQFNLDASGFMVESEVAATPAIVNNNTTNLTAFITNVPSPGSFCFIGPLIAPLPITIPALFNGSPFLGGWAPEGFGMFWNAPALLGGSSQCCVRHILSLNTCNACHTIETATPFTHISPRAFGFTSTLSGFLTGTSVADPSGCSSTTYTYSDLLRRVQDLNAVVVCGCLAETAHAPAAMVH